MRDTDTGHEGRLRVASYRIHLLAEFGRGGDVYEQNRDSDQDQAYVGNREQLPVSEIIEGLILRIRIDHLIHGASAADQFLADMLAEILRQRTEDQHGGQCRNECRDLQTSYQQTVQQAEHCAEGKAEQQGKKHAVRDIEDHYREAGYDGKHGADRQIYVSCQADHAHTDRDDPDSRRMTEDVHRRRPGDAVVGDHVDDQNDHKHEYITVLSQKSGKS